MLALIAGRGALPPALVARLDTPPLVCALDRVEPDVAVTVRFRLETLGSLFDTLRLAGVTQVCMAGAIERPQIDPGLIDAATRPLVPVLLGALSKGDDGALRAVIGLFEAAGFQVKAAHDIAPDLLPPIGVLTKASPAEQSLRDATVAQTAIAQLGVLDQGQACIVQAGAVLAREQADGTDAMLRRFAAQSTPTHFSGSDPISAVFDTVGDVLGEAADWLSGEGARALGANTGPVLFKAPKPQQDRRADLPVIGPGTAQAAVDAGLAGVIIEAGGVMVLDLAKVKDLLDRHGLFLWVRPMEAE